MFILITEAICSINPTDDKTYVSIYVYIFNNTQDKEIIEIRSFMRLIDNIYDVKIL